MATVAIPIASYGKDAKVSEAVREKLLPDYDIVHISLDLATAETEIPALCGGDVNVVPVSGLGSNAAKGPTERVVPKYVMFGGDIPDADVTKLSNLVKEKAGSTSFIKVSKLDVLKAGGLGPNPDVIAKVFRKKIAKDSA